MNRYNGSTIYLLAISPVWSITGKLSLDIILISSRDWSQRWCRQWMTCWGMTYLSYSRSSKTHTTDWRRGNSFQFSSVLAFMTSITHPSFWTIGSLVRARIYLLKVFRCLTFLGIRLCSFMAIVLGWSFLTRWSQRVSWILYYHMRRNAKSLDGRESVTDPKFVTSLCSPHSLADFSHSWDLACWM